MRRIASDMLVQVAVFIMLIAALIAPPAYAQMSSPATVPAGTSGQIQYNNSGAFGGYATTGTTAVAKVVTTTNGTLTSGDCVKIDASGNFVDAGGACGGSAGVASIATSCPTSMSQTGAAVITGTIPINAQTGTTYTVVAGDCGKVITFNNASPVAVTLPQAGTSGFLTGTFFVRFQNLGAGTVTITPTTSTINGAASVSLAQGQSFENVVSDGTNYYGELGLVTNGSSGNVLTSNGSGAFGTALTLTNSSGTKLATSTGALTSGDCVKIDSNGNLVDSGGTCGGSGGTPGGSSGQIQYNNAGSFGGLPTSGTGTTVVTTTGSLSNNNNCVKVGSAGDVIDANVANCSGLTANSNSTGQWYPLHAYVATINAGAAFGGGEVNCVPWYFQGWAKMTVDAIGVVVGTSGSTNTQFALYSSGIDSTTHMMQPQSLLASTGSVANTGAANSNLSAAFGTSYQVTPGNLYFVCINSNDGTFIAKSESSGAVQWNAAFVGGSSPGAAIYLPVQSLKIAQAFGSWPSSLAGSTFAVTSSGGWATAFAYRVASVP